MPCEECDRLFEAWAQASRKHVEAYRNLDRSREGAEQAQSAIEHAFRAMRRVHDAYSEHQASHMVRSDHLRMAG